MAKKNANPNQKSVWLKHVRPQTDNNPLKNWLYKAFYEARSVSPHVASRFVYHDHSKEGRRFASFFTC